MMSGANGDAQLVKQHANVIRMNIADKKRNYCAFVFGSAEDFHAVNFHQAVCGIFSQFFFISGNAFYSDFLQVFQRFSQCCRTDIIGCSCLEFERKFVVSRFFKSDGLDHFTSALIGWNFPKPFPFAVKYSDTGGSVYFMP